MRYCGIVVVVVDVVVVVFVSCLQLASSVKLTT